jgi:hypothetical protein
MRLFLFIFLFFCIATVANAQIPAKNIAEPTRTKTIGNGLLLKVEDCIGDSMSNSITVFYSITNASLANQKIKIEIDDKYPAMAFDDNGNKYYHNKIMLASITSNNTIVTQVPNNVTVWGSITYFNVSNSISKFNLVTFPVASSNWSGNQDLKYEWIEIKNVPVIWNAAKTPNKNIAQNAIQYLAEGSLKKLNNGLDITFVKCEGDVSTQITTVFFTINNFDKANVKIKIDPWGVEKATLIDTKGNSFTFQGASLSNNINNGTVETDLPTGVLIKGSISFRNMLPKNDAIALLNIPLAWRYATENNYFEVDEGNVQFRNIKINWNITKPASSYPYLVKNLDNGVQMFITGCKGDKAAQTATVHYVFYNKSNPIQKLNINPWAGSKSNAIDDNGNEYSFYKNYLANTISNGTIEKILPTNLMLSGSLSFKNVLSNVSKFTLVNLPVNISNWKGGENVFNDVVQLRNLVIDWENKTKIVGKDDLLNNENKDKKTTEDEQYKLNKKLISGIDFNFIECQGDSASQTVTLFFKLHNPNKAHQKVNIDPWFGTYAKAIDENGNDYKFGNLNLGRQYGNGYLKAELPSGLFINGFITFNEVEPSSNFLHLVNIPIYSKNRLDNNEKDYEIIELRNVKINWK